MSRTLARLRETTGDPLLVRAGRGLVPSPRAIELRERDHDWCKTPTRCCVPPKRSTSSNSPAPSRSGRAKDSWRNSGQTSWIASAHKRPAASALRAEAAERQRAATGGQRRPRDRRIDKTIGPEVRTAACSRSLSRGGAGGASTQQGSGHGHALRERQTHQRFARHSRHGPDRRNPDAARTRARGRGVLGSGLCGGTRARARISVDRRCSGASHREVADRDAQLRAALHDAGVLRSPYSGTRALTQTSRIVGSEPA